MTFRPSLLLLEVVKELNAEKVYRKPAQKHCRYSKIPQRLLAVHSQTPTGSRSGSVLPVELQRGTSPGAGRGSAARRARGEQGMVCVGLPTTFTSRSIEKSTTVTLAAVFWCPLGLPCFIYLAFVKLMGLVLWEGLYLHYDEQCGLQELSEQSVQARKLYP